MTAALIAFVIYLLGLTAALFSFFSFQVERVAEPNVEPIPWWAILSVFLFCALWPVWVVIGLVAWALAGWE